MATNNQFLSKGITTVTEAISADNAQDYEKALGLYKRSLEYFMTGLKYEKNPATRQTIMGRVDGYMKRAEDLKVEFKKMHNNGCKSIYIVYV